MTEEKALEKTEKLPAEVIAQSLASEDSVFFNVSRFEHAQRVGRVLAESSMIPEHFRNNIGNCLIALNLAQRMKVDVFMLMQSMYVVHGRPGIEAKLAIALIEGRGKFGPIQFKMSGSAKTSLGVDRPDQCIAYSTDRRSGQIVEGPPVTWKMAEAEGWLKGKPYKSGGGEMPSKWQTMPELMFRYRAATFFARVHDPGSLLGLRTSDELEDMFPTEINVSAAPRKSVTTPTEPDKTEDLQSFTNSIPKNTDPKELEKFLSLTAQANRSTVNEVKVEASKNTTSFWYAFGLWVKKQKNGKTDPEKVDEPKETVPCPQDPTGKTHKFVSFCNEKCSSREGCPGFSAQ